MYLPQCQQRQSRSQSPIFISSFIATFTRVGWAGQRGNVNDNSAFRDSEVWFAPPRRHWNHANARSWYIDTHTQHEASDTVWVSSLTKVRNADILQWPIWKCLQRPIWKCGLIINMLITLWNAYVYIIWNLGFLMEFLREFLMTGMKMPPWNPTHSRQSFVFQGYL